MRHETQGDAEMLKKLKAWKKKKGFEKKEVKEVKAEVAREEPEARQTLPRALEAGFKIFKP